MGYSPPKGRSPTCYSPVRHSHETPKDLIPVRLACLIRAASVRSEPGSNSPSYVVASYSEEQKALLTVFYTSRRSALPPSLDPYLSLPSLFAKNTAGLTHKQNIAEQITHVMGCMARGKYGPYPEITERFSIHQQFRIHRLHWAIGSGCISQGFQAPLP